MTLQKRGAISLNAAAFEALGSPKTVELLYEREKHEIGIRATTLDAEHAYVVRGVGKSGATHVVSGKAFLNYYEIPLDVARRWPAKRSGRRMLTIDIKQQGTDVTTHGSRAHRGGD